MNATYKHTNIVARDWERLAGFYEQAFGCVRVLPIRDLSGSWLEKGTGVRDARIRGVHLLLPGCGKNGPTLEIFQYSENQAKSSPIANREGVRHLAFEVDDVETAVDIIKKLGGGVLGEVVSHEVEGVGRILFAYATDPEDNIIELQNWQQTS